jgi:hypothetical protein
MLPSEPNPDSGILELVNKARGMLEMPMLRKLPRGIPETSQKCVLGRSLGLEILRDDQDRAYALVLLYRTACRLARVWGVARPHGMWNGWAVLLPEALNTFVDEFDARRYPQLASADGAAEDGIISELRHLRFDWVDQHSKVADLIERARDACAQARELRDRLTAARHNS